jgi:hypothetical protein
LTWNSADTDVATGVGVDSSGNSFVAGYWRNGSQYDWGLAKYDSSGVQSWNRTLVWNSTADDQANGVAVDSSGNAFVAGYWNSGGQQDWGLAKYDSSGSQLWSRNLTWNSTGDDQAVGVGVDSSGNVFVAGFWRNGGQDDWG